MTLIFTHPTILGAVATIRSLVSRASKVNKKKNEDRLLGETVRHNKAVEKIWKDCM